MGVSKSNGTPKSSILIEFSIINHPFWGTPIFGITQLHSTVKHPPIHPILIGFSIIKHPFWGTPIFGNIHIQQITGVLNTAHMEDCQKPHKNPSPLKSTGVDPPDPLVMTGLTNRYNFDTQNPTSQGFRKGH